MVFYSIPAKLTFGQSLMKEKQLKKMEKQKRLEKNLFDYDSHSVTDPGTCH